MCVLEKSRCDLSGKLSRIFPTALMDMHNSLNLEFSAGWSSLLYIGIQRNTAGARARISRND